MPKVRKLIQIDKRKAVLIFCMTYKGWDEQILEKELGISSGTRVSRMKDTSTFSINEIQKIIRGVPLSPSQISILLGGVIWDCSGEQMQLMGGFI